MLAKKTTRNLNVIGFVSKIQYNNLVMANSDEMEKSNK
jgi:hypothetical protein